MLVEGFLDAPRGGGSGALVDRECLPQVLSGFGEIAVVEVAVADSFEGAGLLCGGADVAGDGQRLGMLVAGLAGGRGAEREFAEAVAELTEQRQGLLVADGGGLVVSGLLLH